MGCNFRVIDLGDAKRTLTAIESSPETGFDFRKFAMEQLANLQNYNWCGVYVLSGDELVLDAYVGAPTDHVRIPVGRGVCGTAVAENENQIVEDVSLLENYLACSLTTKSEIVVLMRNSSGLILGQIDIDGHSVGAFDKSDEDFLEGVARILAEKWE
jgi:GAF domain-containing protein